MKRKLLTIAVIVIAAVTSLTVFYYPQWQHWISYATGSYNVPGLAHNYNAFSGSLGDVSELGIFIALSTIGYHAYKRNNCHEQHCWRIGSLPVSNYRVCKKHHWQATGSRIDIEQLKVQHHLAKRKRLLDAGYKTKD